MTQLQVLICTYGRSGIESIAARPHPKTDGVGYVVSWQDPEGDGRVPAALAAREDFTIHRSATRGLAVNRNLTLSYASAPLILLSDDDNEYDAEGLRSVIHAFEERPDADILTFRYASAENPIPFPDCEADLRHPPRGWFPISFVMAFRREALAKAGVRFNTDFGIGAEFPSGEEDVLLHDCLRAGLTGRYVPLTVVRHEGPTTSMRDGGKDSFIRTHGAVHFHLHPLTWPLRMLTHSLREARGLQERWRYCRMWMRGAADHRAIVRGRKKSSSR